MKGQEQIFSTGKDDWETPKDVFDKLHERFNFTLDAAASNSNHLLPKYFTEEDNSLIQDWGGERVFCNPPYSICEKFIKKAWEEAYESGLNYDLDEGEEMPPAISHLLIPARTSNEEWHQYIFPSERNRFKGATRLIFFDARLKFSNSANCAPFPSIIVEFNSALHYRRYPEVKMEIETFPIRQRWTKCT